ncbi:hypothetical protein CKM354_000797800 [Cercospora kikuchii]|uniref:ABC transporter domain-containing protein n=1 Tax=Cercospora kikuchii TaxID=84275 RepID=A0A9P3FEV1_9PEZI|nr:uncharacterized protein CKM354_000797800 [Cercospora kikuchii]GIZ44791.1 hypothetical protein CKM354_000797800 [Cercospora kikuchii]
MTSSGTHANTEHDFDEGNDPDQAEQIRRETLVDNLARQFTAESAQVGHENPFDVQPGSPLDPDSPSFSARSWVKAFHKVISQASPRRSAGLAFQNLDVFGSASGAEMYQSTVGSMPFKVVGAIARAFGAQQQRFPILHKMEGLLHEGEMLCVLGPPGSGCSTLLKTIAGETYGFNVSTEAEINYHGIDAKTMHTSYRGEAIYTAEQDEHLPSMTVADTLFFAAMARTPYSLPKGVDRKRYATHLRDVIMAMFGISHTKDTKVGSDFVRGVSGGERKRVTIAEAALCYAPLQVWDNSTRGLDSANAVEFCKTLRVEGDIIGSTSIVAIYQAPQAAYDIFDKVTVLYEGRQIYFGPAEEAKAFFERMGFVCPQGQTTPDFLTSLTNGGERVVASGYEHLVPRTSNDFARKWQESNERRALQAQIAAYNQKHPIKGEDYRTFGQLRKKEKSKHQSTTSPYTMSYLRQVRLCTWRQWQELKATPEVTAFLLLLNFIEALIIASIFFNLKKTTSSFFGRGAVLFMQVALSAFASLLEIITLYAKRPVVEKHKRYALVHPSAEALGSILTSLPFKATNTIVVGSTLYFMANLRREAGAFFFYLLVTFTLVTGMSMFFRFVASITKSLEQALVPASVLMLGLVTYGGFVIPPSYMRGWSSWMKYVNPVYFGFGAITLNEFVGRNFTCDAFVPSGPGYEDVLPALRACNTKGSQPGSSFVQGARYVQTSFQYVNSDKWRNFGILVGFASGLAALHLVVSELVAAKRSKGEILVSKRRKPAVARARLSHSDEEKASESTFSAGTDDSGSPSASEGVQRQTAIFHWQNVCYEVMVKGQARTILDHVDGWVKPGTLTALMGVSGAGKTTLLDVLASRTTTGVISGDMLVDGKPRDNSFQRKTGYAQQSELHLETSTVREALQFSALLRQPSRYTLKERLDYVNTVIDLLDMQHYADAVVGVPGEGLNVEQRKRLTIGVELAARPSLLLFLDEPTSGLDSQTSWSICNLMEKLSKNGQAILCTIHQPSSILFQRFDRLLLLAKGGRTVYFGEIGRNSQILIDYFVANGGADCPAGVNPAEWMLSTIGAAPGSHSSIDWPTTWKNSPEYASVQDTLAQMRNLTRSESATLESEITEFAASFQAQLVQAAKRTFQQYWRTPSYVYSKTFLCVLTAIFIGFSFFKPENTQQGLQNQMFGVFLMLFITIQVIYQVIPMFVIQRTLYESRERQSRTYHWAAFVVSNVLAELVWNTLVAILSFLVWYYPMALFRNAEWTDTVHSRGFLAALFFWVAFLFAGSFAQVLIAALPSAEIASGVATLLGIGLYAFCGILVPKTALPGFWIFMYRVNPFTYIASGILSTTLANAPAKCASNEYLYFSAPANQTCGDYMQSYMSQNGGYLVDPAATGSKECQYCTVANTNRFLQRINVEYGERWRNFGLLWVYIVVNIFLTLALYWAARVPKKNKEKKA